MQHLLFLLGVVVTAAMLGVCMQLEDNGMHPRPFAVALGVVVVDVMQYACSPLHAVLEENAR